jgi:hypothetical protein
MDGWRLLLFTRTCPAKSFVVRHDSGYITISCVCSSGERETGALNRLGKLENVSFCSYRMKRLAVPIGQLERKSGSESPVWVSAARRDPRRVMIPTKWAEIGRQVKQIVPKSTSTGGEEGNLGPGRRSEGAKPRWTGWAVVR